MISVLETVMTYIGFITTILVLVRAIWVFCISNIVYIGTVKIRVYDTVDEMIDVEECCISDMCEIGNQEYAQFNLFRPDNAIIKKMYLQEIRCYSDPLKKEGRNTIHVFRDITPERPACVVTDRPHIPQYVLTWKTDYGAEAEYYFSYNGFNERYNRNSIEYKMGVWARIRKVVGLK